MEETEAAGGENVADAGPKLLRGLLEVFILESLEQAPKHGYALLKEMTETFGQEPNRNRLYPLLGKLVRDGYIREVNESGGNRTLYALTESGHEALRAYRRLPGAFRHALRRIWSVDVHPGAEGAALAESEGLGEGEDDDIDAPSRVPVQVARATVPDGALPYPCPDARMSLEKEPASGDLTIRLTGCPMGAYDHCPQCPIYKAVRGVRDVVFPE